MGLTESARPSRPPPHSLPSRSVLTLIPPSDFESPTSSSPDFGELRRDPPLPYGVSALSHRALPPNRGVSSSSPPIAAIATELRPSRSRPCGLIYSGEPRWSFCPSSTVLEVAPLSSRRLDGCLQPRRRRHAVLGRSAVSTMPPPRRRSLWMVALLPQSWLRRRVAAMVFCLAPL
jgi:hypothetical protein